MSGTNVQVEGRCALSELPAAMFAVGSTMVAVAVAVAVAVILEETAPAVLCHPADFGATFFDRQFPRLYAWSTGPHQSGHTTHQLPHNVIPKSYRLTLVPNLDGDFQFTGRVVVRVFVTEYTRTILLHSHRLDILSVKVTLGSQIFPSTYSLLPLAQMLNITTDKELPYGNNFDLTIDYKGELNDQSVGFYRSKYEMNKTSKWLASTQFEPTFARMAFPCFDEPKFRAEFTICVARYQHQKVTSNMPLKETSSPIKSLKNRVVDIFQTTPFMPTYTVAFVVSEFPFFQESRERFRLWARDDVVKDGEYALSLSEDLLKGFENLTKIRYDLPKVDLAAIPDMSPAAMENWGLITFREPYVLYNTKSRSVSKKERVVTALAHVLAHQWFGNCVTPASWNYLWLKEGFATYFEYFEVAKREFTWRMNEKFVVRITHYALSIDGIHLHRSMNGQAKTPSEIKELFDGISYHKAAAVLRMIENFLSEEQFQNAIKIYLMDRVHDGGITTPNDLYNILELVRLVNQKPMPDRVNLFVMLEQFVDQVGYPLITVTRHSNGDMANVRIKQTPYQSPRSSQKIPDQIWTVPIACAKKSQHHMNNVEPSMWSYNKEEILLENVVEDEEWFICNVQQTGYYRVNYDTENWNLIRDQLKTAPEEIHPLNRAQILDDSYTFALDEKLSFSFALSLLSYLKYETDPIPWYTGIEKLRHLYTQYEATSVAADLKRVAVEIITNFYNFVGFDAKVTDDQPTKEIRKALTMVCCELRISDCVARSESWYYRKNSLRKIPDDVKETVLCTIMRVNSTLSTWDQLWKYYRETHEAAEKETILSALGCSSNQELLKKYLSKLVDDRDDDIRSQNLNNVVRSVLRFYRGVTSTLSFIKDLLPRLKQSKKAPEVILRFLNRMQFLVKSKEHEVLLDDSIEEAKKLDQNAYGDVTATLIKTKKAAQTNIEENDRRVSELSSAVSNYDRSNRKSRWSRHHKSSSSSGSISRAAAALLIFASSVALHWRVHR